MDVRLRELLAVQDNVVAWRQLRALRISERRARGMVADWTEIHDGVCMAGYGEPTKAQRWRAATLSAPRTALSLFSAADFHGVREHRGAFDSVTRVGSRGPQEIGRLRIYYSQTLNGNVRQYDGMWVTTPERTIIDLFPHLNKRDGRKLLREALRLKKTTIHTMTTALKAHKGRRGTSTLNALVSRYERLQLDRCRSDAEAFAMEILDEAGLPLPNVNAMVQGEEADLSWPGLIIEIDGPSYHVLTDEDARKTRAWTEAGNVVRRIGSDTLFAEPERLVELAVTNRGHGT